MIIPALIAVALLASAPPASDLEPVADFFLDPSEEALTALFAPGSPAELYALSVQTADDLGDPSLYIPAEDVIVDGTQVREVGVDDPIEWSDFQVDADGLITDLRRNDEMISGLIVPLDAEFTSDGATLTLISARYISEQSAVSIVGTLTNNGGGTVNVFFTDYVTAGRQLAEAGLSYVDVRPGVTFGVTGAWEGLPDQSGGTVYGYLGEDEIEFDVPPAGSFNAAPTTSSTSP